MSSKRMVGAAGLLAVVVLGLVLILSGWGRSASAAPDAPGERPGVAQPQAAAEPVGSSPAASVRRPWEPGLVHRYELKSDQDVAFKGGQAAAPPAMHFHIAGEWRVGVVVSNEDRVDLRVALVPSALSMLVDGQEPVAPAARRSMEQWLRTPFFLTLDRSGGVRLVHFERGIDSLSEGLLRAVVGASQFVSADGGAATWQTSELDSTGRYSATYRRISSQRYEKKKVAYVSLASTRGLVPVEEGGRVDLHSLATFELGEDLRIGTLEASESLERDLGAGMPLALTSHRLSLRLVDRVVDPSLAGSLLSRQGTLLSQSLATVVGASADPLAHHRQVLGGRSFDDILTNLRALPKDEKARDDARAAALQQLRALFVLQPAEAQRVREVLRSGIDPLAASPVLGGLSAASTPEAIKALSGAVTDEALPSVVRTDAVAALGAVESPTEEGVDTLRKMSRQGEASLRETATLAIGSAAMNLGTSNTRGAAALVDELVRAYRSASSDDDRLLLLHALGNTRAPEAMPLLLDAFGSESALLRQGAVVALRNMPDPSVDEVLGRALLSDPAPEVRRSAVFACGFRPLVPLLGVLRRAMQQEPVVLIREEVVRLLGENRSAAPEVDSLLAWVGENDRSPEVRRAASAALSPSARPLQAGP